MSSIFSSFFQVAGAKSFSDFLKEDDKKPRKRTKRRSLRKTVAQRKSRRRTTRKTARRTARKTARRTARKTARRTARKTARKTARRTARKTARRSSRRTARRTAKFIKARNLTKRKFVGSPGKYQCVNGCDKNTKGGYFTGKEPSPKGMGYCARCTPLNIMMKGVDGNLWEIKKYSKGKRWVRV